MTNYYEITNNPIFSEEEREHILGVTEFIDTILNLKENEKFFDKRYISRLDIELNRNNASYDLKNRKEYVISNIKAYTEGGERISDMTNELYNLLGREKSPLQKVSAKFLTGAPQYRYTNYSFNINDDLESQIKKSLVTDELLKKLEIATLGNELTNELNSLTTKKPSLRKL